MAAILRSIEGCSMPKIQLLFERITPIVCKQAPLQNLYKLLLVSVEIAGAGGAAAGPRDGSLEPAVEKRYLRIS
jgi:hypothetical protein